MENQQAKQKRHAAERLIADLELDVHICTTYRNILRKGKKYVSLLAADQLIQEKQIQLQTLRIRTQ